MRRIGKYLRAWVFLAGLGINVCVAESAAKFDRPKDHLGPANFEGKLHKWFELGEIKLSDGTVLPFRLLFTTLPQKGGGVFGKFWWCPVLESTLVPISESHYILSTLGGRHVYLGKEKTGELRNDDGTWKGEVSLGIISVFGPNGWKYTYQKGRLIAAEKGEQLRLKWIFAEDRPAAIEDQRGTALLKLSYARNGAIPSAMDIGNAQYKITEQSVPTVVNANGVPVIGAFERSLSGIVTPWRWWTFHVQLEENGARYDLSYSDTGVTNQKFSWQSETGLLSSDGFFSYDLDFRDGGIGPVVTRKNSKGQVESYFYNAKTGVSEHKRLDGDTIRRSYFLAAGPTSLKPRKIERFGKTGEKMSSAQFSYNEQGRLIRMTEGLYEKRISYNAQGQIADLVESWEGVPYEEKVYDGSGNLLKWRSKNQLLEYDPKAGTAKKSINNQVVAMGLRGQWSVFDGKNLPSAKPHVPAPGFNLPGVPSNVLPSEPNVQRGSK